MADKNICEECGSEHSQNAKFCGSCGTKIIRTLTLDSFYKDKELERHSLFKPKKLKVKEGSSNTATNSTPKNIHLQVGLMKSDGNGGLKKVRGGWVSLSLSPNAGWKEVRRAAVSKHADQDQYFCAFFDYVLLYPDEKVCRLLPNTNEELR